MSVWIIFKKVLVFLGLLALTEGAAPVCNAVPSTVTTGINITTPTVLSSITCTDSDGDAVTISVDTTSDGYGYFDVSGSNFRLVNRLDVEYGQLTWIVRVLGVDNSMTPQTGTVAVTIITYQSTTTSTTTPAPPGYSWFKNTDNVILFGTMVAFTALTTGFCILMCFRFRRTGTCLPRFCPEYRHCKAAFGRQCSCCPLPCDFYKPSDQKRLIAPAPFEPHVQSPLPPPKPSIQFEIASNTPPPVYTHPQSPEDERAMIVSPVIVGNVQLTDVGLDGMRSPGFNAPMFTSYGGKEHNLSTFGKRRH